MSVCIHIYISLSLSLSLLLNIHLIQYIYIHYWHCFKEWHFSRQGLGIPYLLNSIPYFPRVQWDSGNSLFGILTNIFLWIPCLFLFLFFVIFVFIFCYFMIFDFLVFWIFDSICLLFFEPFCPELGPGSATIGFSEKNYIGYSNSRPNWRQESMFYEHVIVFPAPPAYTGHSLKK